QKQFTTGERVRQKQGGEKATTKSRRGTSATPASRQPGAERSRYDEKSPTSSDRALYQTIRNTHTSRGGTMPHDNQLDELSSFVNRAETQRTFQNTTALQNYLDQHPQLADLTLQMTAEIKQKPLFYVGNADQKAQQQLQEEL